MALPPSTTSSASSARHASTKSRRSTTTWCWRTWRSVEMDLSTPAGTKLMWALLAKADVFIHNLGPGSVDKLAFGWEKLHATWPSLISCAISGYGPDGPYSERKALDLLVQGEAGVLAVTGTADQPAKVGVSIADVGAGMYALSALLAALYDRQSTRECKRVDISNFVTRDAKRTS